LRQHQLPVLSLFLVLLLSCVASIPQAQAAKTISYNAGTDIITYAGGSDGDEITMLDLWNADVAGSWGRIHNNNGSNIQWQVDCKLLQSAGTTDTWFASENEQIVFTKNVAETLFIFGWYYASTAHFRLGDLDDFGRSCNGSHIIFMDYSATKTFRSYNAEVEFYDSRISMVGDASGNDPVIFEGGLSNNGKLRILDSRIEYAEPQRLSINIDDAFIDGFELYNATLLVNQTPDYEWNNIKIMGTPENNLALVAQFARPLIIKGLTFTHDSGVWGIDLYGTDNATSCHLELINPIWNYSQVVFWQPINDEWAKIYWTFDLIATYPNGTAFANANITISNMIQGIIYEDTTDSNGEIPQQLLLERLYDASSGGTAFNASYYNYNPYWLNATSTDEQYIYYKSWTLENLANWEIALLPSTTPSLFTPTALALSTTFAIPYALCFALILNYSYRKRRKNTSNTQ
jgi:hypothetical protein